jgi:hypothetical protein
VQRPGDVSVVTHDAGDGEQQARAEGLLTTVGGCVAIAIEAEKYLLVFPSQAVVDDLGTVTVEDGTTLRLGEQVALGGGFTTTEMFDDTVLSEIPDACVTKELFLVS